MKQPTRHRWIASLMAVAALVAVLVTACAPAAAPTPTPTKAAPAAAPTTAPAKAEATKPAEKPAATPTTAAAKPTGAPVKIGFVVPLSGALASYGFLQRIAGRLAEEDINSSGGINGSPLQLLIEDSPFDPKQAVTAVRKLAEQDKVFAIVGPYATAEMEVAAPMANELKMVVASGSATKVGLAEANRPWAFQMNVRDSINTPPAIDAFKKRNPNVKRVVLTGDTKESVTEYMVKDLMPKLLKEKGLDIIDTVPFERGTTDFSAIVTKIKGLNPDGIVVASLMPEALGLSKELQRQQVKAPVMTDGHPTGGPLLQLAGETVEGWVMPTYFDWENPDPKVQNFVKRFFERAQADSNVNPKPQHLVTEGSYYDTVMIMADIMRKANVKGDTPLQEARQKVMEGMTNLKDYAGVGGKITMLPSGNTDRPPTPAVLLEKGKYNIVR